MFQVKHWQDPVNGALGAWLLLSPWILGYSGEAAAMPNAVIVGIALIAAAARRLLSSPRAQRRFHLAGGSLLSAAGVWALLAKRPA